MSTSSGRHSGCSTRRASRRDRPDPWGTICLLPGFRHAADEGTLPNARAERARPVIDLVAGVELDRAARVIAHVSAGTAATGPRGFRARAAESDSRHEQHEDRAPAANHVIRSEEKTMTARRISPPSRISTGRSAHRGPRARQPMYK